MMSIKRLIASAVDRPAFLLAWTAASALLVGTFLSRTVLAITCPSFIAGKACSLNGPNSCPLSCVSEDGTYSCDNGQGIYWSKVVSVTTPWMRCSSYQPSSSQQPKSCAEVGTSCGVTQNYLSSFNGCQLQCTSSWTWFSCAAFRADSCGN